MYNEKIIELKAKEVEQYQNMLNKTMEEQPNICKDQVFDGWCVQFEDGTEGYIDICTDVDDECCPYVCMKLNIDCEYVEVGDCESVLAGEHTLMYKGNEYCIKVVAI